MPDETLLAMSAVAALAVFPGLLGRRGFPGGRAGVRLRSGLAGFLAFLAWGLLTRGYQPVGSAIEQLRDGLDGAEPVATLTAVFLIGLAAGFGLLAWREAALARAYPELLGATGAPRSAGPGTMTAAELNVLGPTTRALRLALWVAAGVGLHGALVGLALGSHGEQDEIAFTYLLALGLALYAGAEGLGFANLFARNTGRPRLRFRWLLGLIAGVPLILATVAGMYLTDETVTVALCGLAAGALTHTVLRLVSTDAATRRRQPMVLAAMFGGLAGGFLLSVIVTALAGSVD